MSVWVYCAVLQHISKSTSENVETLLKRGVNTLYYTVQCNTFINRTNSTNIVVFRALTLSIPRAVSLKNASCSEVFPPPPSSLASPRPLLTTVSWAVSNSASLSCRLVRRSSLAPSVPSSSLPPSLSVGMGGGECTYQHYYI